MINATLQHVTEHVIDESVGKYELTITVKTEDGQLRQWCVPSTFHGYEHIASAFKQAQPGQYCVVFVGGPNSKRCGRVQRIVLA